MREIFDLMQKAEEIYDLGVKMQETFCKTDADKKHYMVLAIAAGLKEYHPPVKITPIDELVKIRKEKGITLRQIEDATGISNSYLSQLENGKINKPSQSVMEKLTNFIISGIPFIEHENKFDPLVPGSGLLGL